MQHAICEIFNTRSLGAPLGPNFEVAAIWAGFRPFGFPVSGHFDTSGSIIALSVSEISALDGFCDEHEHNGEELVIIVVGCNVKYAEQYLCLYVQFKHWCCFFRSQFPP